MTSRVRWLLAAGCWLLVAGIFCVFVAACLFLLPWENARSSASRTAVTHSAIARFMPPHTVNKPPFNQGQLNQFLTAARQAEEIPDLLQRCLSYPDPPGLAWSKTVTSAYCHYQFDPWVTPSEARELIQTGHAAELDKRLADAMHAQSSQPGMQGALDRTFNIDFRNGSEEIRALMDAWKRQSPMSAFALAASGTAYVQMAQQIRGSDYAAKTPQNSFESMSRLLEAARVDLDQAAKIDSHLTPIYTAMIYAGTLDSDSSYIMSAAKRGLAIDPASYTIYARLVWMAQPKWGGSVEAMQRIIASAQHHASDNPLLKLLASERSGGEAYVENCLCNPKGDLKLYQQVFAEAAPVGMLMSAGWAAKNRNFPELAVIYRSQLLRFDPSQIEHREGRAFDLPALGYSDWAIAEGNTLIKLAPQDENAFDVRGMAYESTGNFNGAIEDYEQALRINPSDSWTLIELGNIYVKSSHEWDKGWIMANRLIQMSPDDPRGWLLRANIQKNQPRNGLNQTVADFVARFGNDPAKQGLVAVMRSMQKDLR